MDDFETDGPEWVVTCLVSEPGGPDERIAVTVSAATENEARQEAVASFPDTCTVIVEHVEGPR